MTRSFPHATARARKQARRFRTDSALLLLLMPCVLSSGCEDGEQSSNASWQADVAAVQAALTFPACHGSVFVQIDGTDDATYNDTTHHIQDNGVGFNAAKHGPVDEENYYRNAWFSPSVLYRGLPSLMYRVRPCSPTGACSGQNTVKLHHHLLADLDLEASVQSPERRYAGFAFYVSSESDLPMDLGRLDGTPLVFQMWQGGPYKPPFSAHIVRNAGGNRDLVFAVRSDTVGGDGHEIGRITNILTDTWYEFVLSFYPEMESAAHQPGNVTVGVFWRLADLDDPDEPEWNSITYHGKWSYDRNLYPEPDPEDPEADPKPNPVLDFKMGLYHGAADYTAHKVAFANLKWTDQFATAKPTYLCTATF